MRFLSRRAYRYDYENAPWSYIFTLENNVSIKFNLRRFNT